MVKFPDYYVFQFMDGTFRIACFTRPRFGPELPLQVLDAVYDTAKDAYRAIDLTPPPERE